MAATSWAFPAQDWAAESFTTASICAPTNHDDGGAGHIENTKHTVHQSHNRSCTVNFIIIYLWLKTMYFHCSKTTQKNAPCASYSFYPLRVGTSRYGPPSGIYNTHAPLCVLCMLFLEGYEANMPINSKRRCVVVLMSCDTWTNHDHRSERFQKSLVMVCIASMEWWKGKSFILPQWLTLLWKNLTAPRFRSGVIQ